MYAHLKRIIHCFDTHGFHTCILERKKTKKNRNNQFFLHYFLLITTTEDKIKTIYLRLDTYTATCTILCSYLTYIIYSKLLARHTNYVTNNRMCTFFFTLFPFFINYIKTHNQYQTEIQKPTRKLNKRQLYKQQRKESGIREWDRTYLPRFFRLPQRSFSRSLLENERKRLDVISRRQLYQQFLLGTDFLFTTLLNQNQISLDSYTAL